MTTAVEPMISLRWGQVTFFNSTRTSLRNWTVDPHSVCTRSTTAVMSYPFVRSPESTATAASDSASNGRSPRAVAQPLLRSLSVSYGRPGGIRTPNLRIWSPPLYH